MTCFRLPNGENLNQYCKRTGRPYNSVWNRIEKGWTLEDAINKPFLAKHGIKYFIDGEPARHALSYNGYQRYLRRLHEEEKRNG